MKLEHVFKMPHRMPTYLSSPFAISNAIWVVLKKKKKLAKALPYCVGIFANMPKEKKFLFPNEKKVEIYFQILRDPNWYLIL